MEKISLLYQRYTKEQFATLSDGLHAWRYTGKVLPEGLVITRYLGNQWGLEELMFQTIAPYLANNASIHCMSRQKYWVYTFLNGKMKTTIGDFDQAYH